MKVKSEKELIDYFDDRKYHVCLHFMRDTSPSGYTVDEYKCSISYDRICQKTERIDFLDFTPYKKNNKINYNKIKKTIKRIIKKEIVCLVN